MRILLVEDEARLARHLVRGLVEESYAVDHAASVAEARRLADGTGYDLVILDLLLPDRSGLELLESWRRQRFDAPVLILTALDRLGHKVRGLDAGADDYLTKPFDFEELLARVRSLLRRRPVPPVQTLRLDDLELDRTGMRATLGGEPLDLTPKEIGLLEFLLLHRDRVLDRSTIAEHVWDAGYEARTNVIDVFIARLRKKLEVDGRERIIHTVKGHGYVLRTTAPDGETRR